MNEERRHQRQKEKMDGLCGESVLHGVRRNRNEEGNWKKAQGLVGPGEKRGEKGRL